MLSESLSERGYTVKLSLLAVAGDETNSEEVGGSVVVVAVVSEGFLDADGASDVLRWAREGEKVVQPVVHVADKRKISEWVGRVPSYARKKDWVDLQPGDAEYWACGVRKVLKSAGDEAAKLSAERHEESTVVTRGPCTARCNAAAASSSTKDKGFSLGTFLHCVGGTCTRPGFDVAEASEVPTAARLPSAAPPAVGTRGGGLDAGPAAQTLPRPVQLVQKAAKRALLLTARPPADDKNVCRV